MVACPRAPAAGGGPVPRLRHSDEGEAAWLGLGAPLGRGEAVPGVDWSCGRAEVGARRGAGGRRRSEPRRRSPTALGGGERVEELRHGERKLAAGSTQAERCRRWGLRGEPVLRGNNGDGSPGRARAGSELGLI